MRGAPQSGFSTLISVMPSMTCLFILKTESRLVRITVSQSALLIFLTWCPSLFRHCCQNVDGPDVLRHSRDALPAWVDISNVDPIGTELASGRAMLAEPAFGSRVARRMGYHHAIACCMHLGADRFAQTTHSTCDECHAGCCPPNRCCVDGYP